MTNSNRLSVILQRLSFRKKGGPVLFELELEEIRKSGLFDPDWYIQQYPDVKTNVKDPLVHFMNHGWRELRDPSILFDTKWYLETYPDDCTNGVNPLLHYIRHGLRDGRPSRDVESDEQKAAGKFNLPPTFLDNISANSVAELIDQAQKLSHQPDPFVAYGLMVRA